MTVVVSFIQVAGLGTPDAPVIRRVRAREDLALNGTTTATVRVDEYVVVGNAESSMIAAAFGTTPDAAALLETSATSAGLPVPSGLTEVLSPAVGDKISVKAVA